MTRLYGRSQVGERCLSAVPYGHWQSATFIAALRHDGIGAPWLVDGPMDGELFLTYVRQVLAPELQPGDLVICDNLASHKVSGVKEAIAACGAELCLPSSLQPRSQPHRNGVLQAQGPGAPSCRKNLGPTAPGNGPSPRHILTPAMRELLSPCLLCDRLNRKCSKQPLPRPLLFRPGGDATRHGLRGAHANRKWRMDLIVNDYAALQYRDALLKRSPIRTGTP